MGRFNSPLVVLLVAATTWTGQFLVAADAIEPVEAPQPAEWRLRRTPVESKKPLRPVGLLVEQLASPKFAERAQASRDLVRMGAPAVGALAEAAASDQPERSMRAVSALEDLFLNSLDNDNDEATAAAFGALDRLSLSEDPVLRSRVEAALAANEADLYKYSLDELARLGGSIRMREGMSIIDDNGMIRPDIDLVILDKKWQGGADGLRHVRRIRPARGLYIISGANVPTEAIDKFKAESQINVQTRGRAQLGVVNNGLVLGNNGVTVYEVAGAAAQAGIQPQDVIVEFNGAPIKTFEELIAQIEHTEPGQTVPVTIVRGAGSIQLEVTMAAWLP